MSPYLDAIWVLAMHFAAASVGWQGVFAPERKEDFSGAEMIIGIIVCNVVGFLAAVVCWLTLQHVNEWPPTAAVSAAFSVIAEGLAIMVFYRIILKKYTA